MTATITNMDFVFADYLYVDQLMEDDFIKLDGEIFQVTSIASTDGGFMITVLDDFDEGEQIFIADNTKLEWYVIAD